MTLTVKDSPADSALGTPSSSSRSSESPSTSAPRSNPVCLEVPVVVRSLPGEQSVGSGPTREEGRTVIVFDNGAVLRISIHLPPGQTVILSNQQGRDVVCRVMGGRNLPNKGYIEIEFIEPVDDFWRIHQTAIPAETRTLPSPAAIKPVTLADPPNLPTAAVPQSNAAPSPMDSSQSETDLFPGSAPTFEDVAGLVSMAPPSRAIRSTKKAEASTLAATAKQNFTGITDGNDAETRRSESSSLSSTRVTPLISELPPEKSTSPSSRESAPSPARKSSPPDVLAGKGVLASPYSGAETSSGAARKPLPLLVGGVALVLLGFGSGYFFMHHGTAPAAAPATTDRESASAVPPVNSAVPGVSVPQSGDRLPAESQFPSVTPQTGTDTTPVAIASLGKEPSSSGALDSSRASEARQPERAQGRKPTISNLKMKTPVAPNGTSGKLSDAPALSAADFSSAVTPGGTSVLPSVMRSEPAAPAGSLAPPTSKSIREPQLISSVHAVYPAFAKQSNVQGKVVMNLTVDAKGDVVNAIVISGPPFLRQSATDAVKQWKYSPALIDGRPASAQISVSLDFRLN